MVDLFVFLTVTSIFFIIYKIFELFLRRKERMAIIDKMQFNMNIDNRLLSDKLNMPMFSQKKIPSTWALRAALLMIGIGLGLIMAFIIECVFISESIDPEFSKYEWEVQSNIKKTIGVIYFACVSLFGGAGLLVAYFIERKNEKGCKE